MQKVEEQNRVSELDGMRGLAILIVFVYHLVGFARTLPRTPFLKLTLVDLVGIGWIGVDIFFVLSGFLITSILLKTRTEQHYFRNFYVRRILRIFPLYYLVVGIVYIFFPLIISPQENMVTVQGGLPFLLLYIQNWLYIPKFIYYFNASVPTFLGPSWSLAIEEQFYFLWPAVVYFLSRRNLVILTVIILVLSLFTRLFLIMFAADWTSLEEFIHFSTITHFDGLCVGALIAIAFQSEVWKQRLTRLAGPIFIGSLIALIMILILSGNFFILVKNVYRDIWGYTGLAFASGAFLVLAITQPAQSHLRTFLRNPVFMFWGKYSYAIYILHIPIMLLILKQMKALNYRGDFAWFIFLILASVLTILAALLTWHGLEKHALGLKKYFEYQPSQLEGKS